MTFDQKFEEAEINNGKVLAELPPEPTEPGWYRTQNTTSWMVYSLDEHGNWTAHQLGGDVPAIEGLEWYHISSSGPVELLLSYKQGVLS